MVDPEEGPGGPPPLFLHQTGARRAEKKFLETAGPVPSSPLIGRSGSVTAQVPISRLVNLTCAVLLHLVEHQSPDQCYIRRDDFT